MKHYLTKYVSKGVSYATSWLQINFLGKSFCFSKRTITLSQQ